MAVNLVTGGLGTGKSFFAVRKGCEALDKGRLLVTNFALEADWAEQIVYGRAFGRSVRRTAKREARVSELQSRYHRVRDIDELMRVQVRREKPFVKWHKRAERWVVREGSCVVILDEVHRWMNAREWAQSERKEILDWVSLSRKEGMELYMLSQAADNVDAQVRRLCEDHIKLNNLRRSARFLGFRVIPFDVFLAVTVNMHYPKEIARRDHYLLNRSKHLYDTMDVLSFNERSEAVGEALWLPARATEDPPDSTASGARSGARTPGAAPTAGTAMTGPADDAALLLRESGEAE